MNRIHFMPLKLNYCSPQNASIPLNLTQRNRYEVANRVSTKNSLPPHQSSPHSSTRNLTQTTANLQAIHCNCHLIHLLHCLWLFFQETVTMQKFQAHKVLISTPFLPFLLHVTLVLFELPSFGVFVFASKFIYTVQSVIFFLPITEVYF